ncbi:hypothetical protein PL8927_900016 [Planktothrix serta PCC 8927]|uniref:Uncharacterized protein n=1 Tax=Planktothrix serta PCC 8927 TaxID=671068 RepID=A0A7Z9C4F1_9CYAN|nr:hypothetical protein [Planktothrix serta]VXD25615.1 hypothetical protein PL8927_900016 [Planktothrix serta PCC 8927]
MTVADSGPYKSRLFNFISLTAQKLSDEGSRTWRYFRFATEITLQTALYPVYFLLQTVRVTTQKLGTAIKQRLPQLQSPQNPPPQPPDVDTAIVHILNTVTTETESLFPNSITSPTLDIEIQGIASQLDSQTLVLVKTDNQILDSLTVEQQHQLQQQILLEEGDYFYFDQNLAQQQNPFSTPIPPLRWFSQVMSWIQTSPVAVKINCFGESDVVDSVSFPLPSPEFIHNLDGAIAQVEDYSIIPLSQVTHSLVHQSQTWGKTVIQVWRQPPQPHLSVKSESTLEQGFDEYFYKIQSLILAAVDYFFGSHHPPISSVETPEQFSGVISASSSSPTLTPLEDPWLTANNLTNNILSKLQKPKIAKSRPSSPSQTPKTPNNLPDQNAVWEKVQLSLNRFQTEETPTNPLTKSIDYVKESPETHADWLEAQVTVTGYIKHPLEQILGWLDQLMVRVEETVAKVWYWLSHYRKN